MLMFVEILKLMLGRDSEDEIWSRFMFELVIWLQEFTFKMNSTLGSVVPLAIFYILHWKFIFFLSDLCFYSCLCVCPCLCLCLCPKKDEQTGRILLVVSSQVAHTDQSWVLLPWASTVQRTMGPLAAHHHWHPPTHAHRGLPPLLLQAHL